MTDQTSTPEKNRQGASVETDIIVSIIEHGDSNEQNFKAENASQTVFSDGLELEDENLTVCLGSINIYFFYFHFYACFGMLSTGMGESFLLSEDEPLTPNIDGVIAL